MRYLTVMLLLVLFTVAPLNAQEATPEVTPEAAPDCSGLPAADCEIILSAAAYTAENLTSAQPEFTFSYSLQGLTELGLGEDASMTVTGSGSYRVTGSEEAPIEVNLVMDIEQITGEREDSGEVALIFTENMAYARNAAGEWKSTSLTEAMETRSLGLPFSLNEIAINGLPFASNPDDLLAQLNLADVSDIDQLTEVPGFVSYVRQPDVTENGQTLYPFAFTLDFNPLFTSEAFSQVLASSLALLAQVNPDTDLLAQFLPQVLEDSEATFTSTQWVGAEDNFIHRLSFEGEAVVDLSSLFGGGDDVQPITFNFRFDLRLNAINEPVEITAPEDAQPVPPEQFNFQ